MVADNSRAIPDDNHGLSLPEYSRTNSRRLQRLLRARCEDRYFCRRQIVPFATCRLHRNHPQARSAPKIPTYCARHAIGELARPKSPPALRQYGSAIA
jgi:hypothetical protein